MVRMSDIFKKAKEREMSLEEKESVSSDSSQLEKSQENAREKKSPEIKGEEGEGYRGKAKKAEVSDVKFSSIVKKGDQVLSEEDTLKLYEESKSLIEEIEKKGVDYKSIDVKKITAQVEKLADQLRYRNEKLLMLAFTGDSLDKNYLYCHTVNVCILSIEVGMGLGYDRSKLTEIGISALLHDIGMFEYLYLSKLPRRLTTEEHEEIKKHPIRAAEILNNIKDIAKIAIHTILQHHERINGSGYPMALKGESIGEYAKMLGIVDVYEAIIHPRSYRNEYLPLDAMREIIANKKAFEYKLLKILIEKVGIFPVGSLIELNTKEIAQIIKFNHKTPLRPIVKIIFDANGKKPKEEKKLDLTTHPAIYIKRGVRKDELKSPLI